MKRNLLMLAAIGLFSLTGCQTNEWGSKQSIGTGIGAVAGGVLGSQIGSGSGQHWAIGAGVLLGALAGNEVGLSLDRADKMYMAQAQNKALSAPTGETVTWNNPESENHGSYKVVRDGMSDRGNYCREFQQEITVGGERQKGYGTACQQPDGTWHLL